MKQTNLYQSNILTVITWTLVYLLVCGIIPTTIDILIKNVVNIQILSIVNLVLTTVLNFLFIYVLIKKYNIKINLFNNVSLINILFAIACSILFFLVLDKCLDPFFDSLFIDSAIEYQQSINSLKEIPIISFFQICLIAPIIEETFIRGCILNSLKNKYGVAIAILISSIIFAVLHFNFVQTISALICGIVLGLLYIKTNSLFCCILTHFIYNTISFFTIIMG